MLVAMFPKAQAPSHAAMPRCPGAVDLIASDFRCRVFLAIDLVPSRVFLVNNSRVLLRQAMSILVGLGFNSKLSEAFWSCPQGRNQSTCNLPRHYSSI